MIRAFHEVRSHYGGYSACNAVLTSSLLSMFGPTAAAARMLRTVSSQLFRLKTFSPLLSKSRLFSGFYIIPNEAPSDY
jgi:hypothetical protein